MKTKITRVLVLCLWIITYFPADLSAQGIEITSGATITASGAATIEINNGSFINNGSYFKGNETVLMSGGTAAMISGSSLSDFWNLSLTNTGGVSIDNGSAVTVSGTLSNTVGVDGLILKSNSSGYGSLIHGTAMVQGKVERAIIGATWTEANDGWHLLSSPVVNQSVSGQWTPAGAGNDYDFYAWSESALSDNWLNQKDAGNGITSFVPGQGYLVAYEQSETKLFSGVLNTSAVSLSGLTHTSGNDYAGWHLAGNPYSSAIDWSNVNWTKTNIGANAKIWVEADMSYKDITSDYANIIPAMNGFMVYVDEATIGTLTIPVEARVHNTTNWLKSTPDGYLILTARDLEHQSAQETILRVESAATNGFDLAFDSKFMAGFAPMFYSVCEGNYLSLNTIPKLDPGSVIELGFVRNNASDFSIGLSMGTMPEGLNAYLTDKFTGIITDLTATPVYYFTSTVGDNANRFSLKFSTVGINELTANDGLEVFAYGNTVYLSSLKSLSATVLIRNLTGQLVQQTLVSGSSSVELGLPHLPAGVYIVTVIDGKLVRSKKIVLK